MEDETQLLYDTDLLSENKLEEYANDYMYYNNGVFPYVAKDIWYLDLAVRYRKDRDTMTEEVTDISFESGKDKWGVIIAVGINTMWVFKQRIRMK